MYFVLKFCIFVLILIKCTRTKNCTCVPFFQCDDDYNIISDGNGLLEGRRFDECEGFLNVCCKIVSPPITEPPLKQQPKGCGTNDPENFPWSASLLHKRYPKFVSSYRCRVSLIHERVALTAAHCFNERGYYQVRIGSTIRGVIRVYQHRSFKLATLRNDVILLILNKPFKLGRIGTVCIPPPEAVWHGTNCTTATHKESNDKNLKLIQIPVIERNDCVEKLRKSHLGTFFQLHESFICAGGGAEDTSEGDGGSPLICRVPGVPGRYQQIGIVSWGIGEDNDVPGIYVNLGYFRNWIDEIMEENGFNTSGYRI